MEMTKINPNFENAQNCAYRLIKTYASLPNKIFPISPKVIIEQISNIKLESYSNLASLTESSVDEICEMLDSTDGSTFYDPNENRYVVAYNDQIGYESRIKFTIAHELGHIYLGHVLDHRTYDVQEKEANYFAKRLLVPLPFISEALTQTKLSKLTASDIAFIFKVSLNVAEYSIDNFNNLRFSPTDIDLCNPFKRDIARQLFYVETAKKLLAQ